MKNNKSKKKIIISKDFNKLAKAFIKSKFKDVEIIEIPSSFLVNDMWETYLSKHKIVKWNERKEVKSNVSK